MEITPRHKLFEEVKSCLDLVVNNRKSIEEVSYELISIGYSPKEVEKIISLTKKMIVQKNNYNQAEFYALHLERVFKLYQENAISDPKLALQALKEHKETYFFLSQILE